MTLNRIVFFAHNIWLSSGRPTSGSIFELKKHAKYKYKLAIRDAVNEFEGRFDDELLSSYVRKDFSSFWKTWKKKVSTKRPNVSVIDSVSDDREIVKKFATYFQKCQNVKEDEPSSVMSVFADIIDKTDTVSDWFFNIEDVEKAVGSLKFGKASGADGITTEHLRYAHPSIVFHLKSLFNLILLHSYVPNDFGRGIIVPLVKDRHGDCGNLDNYRGITVSSII